MEVKCVCVYVRVCECVCMRKGVRLCLYQLAKKGGCDNWNSQLQKGA